MAQAAVQAASPVDDVRGSAAHRRLVIVPLVQRTLQYAVQMAQGSRLSFAMQRNLAVELLQKLLKGELYGFSTDQLLRFLTALGQDVEIVVKAPARRRQSRGKLTVRAA